MKAAFDTDILALSRFNELQEEPGADLKGPVDLEVKHAGFTAVYKLEGDHIEMVVKPDNGVIENILTSMRITDAMGKL